MSASVEALTSKRWSIPFKTFLGYTFYTFNRGAVEGI
jgi:hypothetical protein